MMTMVMTVSVWLYSAQIKIFIAWYLLPCMVLFKNIYLSVPSLS